MQELPAKTIPATLECAGNSRVFLVPKVKGTQWELGAVGNAEWTGVSLGELLRQAGVKSGAIEVILEGAIAARSPSHRDRRAKSIMRAAFR